jgi:hypothetical protein
VVVQLASSNGLNQGIDDRRELVLGWHHDTRLALLELDGLGTELDRHHDLAGGVSLPPGLNSLLADDDLLLALDFSSPVNGPDVSRVLKELLLLLQLRDEFCPPDMDRVVGILGQRGERKRLQNWHVGFSKGWTNPADSNILHALVTGRPSLFFETSYNAEARVAGAALRRGARLSPADDSPDCKLQLRMVSAVWAGR